MNFIILYISFGVYYDVVIRFYNLFESIGFLVVEIGRMYLIIVKIILIIFLCLS